MERFRVWAPLRRQVHVEVNGACYPMRADSGGWWTCDEVAANPGDEYKFRLDGEASFPDPRSRFQPHGVHGPSQVVSPAEFPWTDRNFRAVPLSAAILYELHIGTFSEGGTFDTAIERLPHLAELGITHIELMPIVEFGGSRGWGYDGVYSFAPHHAYGDPASLARFVDAAHALGMGVILDVVYNHFGPVGNYLAQFGPYTTDRHITPWGAAINFDGPYSDDVRDYFIASACMWLSEYHFDGLRLDAIHAIVDTSATPFLEQLSREVRQLEAHLARPLVLIAESNLTDPRIVRPLDCDGLGMHAQWNDDFHHALHVALTGEQHGYYRDFGGIETLADVFTQPFLYAGNYSRFRRRSHGRPARNPTASSFVVCSQNHDQIGNRARGERLVHLVSADHAKIAAALTILSPYIPLLFQGEEWSASTPFQFFVDFSDDLELARAVAVGRRKEFPEEPSDNVPDPNSRETFENSRLRWSEIEQAPHRDMLEWYKNLIRARKTYPGIVDGRLERVSTSFDADARWLVVARGRTVLVANLSDEPRVIEWELSPAARVAVGSKSLELGHNEIRMPAASVGLIILEGSDMPRPTNLAKNQTSRHSAGRASRGG